MSREERKLRKHLEEQARRELRKANKHMTKVRAGEWKPPRERVEARWIDDESEAEPEFRPTKHQRPIPSKGLGHGMVVETGLGFCDVLCNGERVRCESQCADQQQGEGALERQHRLLQYRKDSRAESKDARWMR